MIIKLSLVLRIVIGFIFVVSGFGIGWHRFRFWLISVNL